DVDGDGWGNNADYDDDGDGIADPDDDDDDGDGYSDADEGDPDNAGNCVGDGGNSLTQTITPDDMDGDLICDYLDTDRDGDGTDNTGDAFEDDACADTDTDGDGMPDSIVAGCTTTLTEDSDDDAAAGAAWSISTSSYSTLDVEIYVGGVLQCTLSTYYDTDGPCEISSGDIEVYVDYCSWYCGYYGDSTDTFISVSYGGSLVETLTQCSYSTYSSCNWYWLYPGTLTTLLESSYAVVWSDASETECGTDPVDSSDTPTDTDGDGLCDDIQDSDNDNDGFSNADEADCGESNSNTSDADYPTDTDADGVCDGLDDDDDGDGTVDTDDAFPL
ncbi:uncharacterized protein METZ01_LOCUS339851, partial [marine metagenome]